MPSLSDPVLVCCYATQTTVAPAYACAPCMCTFIIIIFFLRNTLCPYAKNGFRIGVQYVNYVLNGEEELESRAKFGDANGYLKCQKEMCGVEVHIFFVFF